MQKYYFASVTSTILFVTTISIKTLWTKSSSFIIKRIVVDKLTTTPIRLIHNNYNNIMVTTRQRTALLESHKQTTADHVRNVTTSNTVKPSPASRTKVAVPISSKRTTSKINQKKQQYESKKEAPIASNQDILPSSASKKPKKQLKKNTKKDNGTSDSMDEMKLQEIDGKLVLFSLNDDHHPNANDDDNNDDNLVQATILCRPSKYNRSPYVADIRLHHENRDAIAHVPNLDMGGKCIEGSIVLVKASRDKKTGQKIGSNGTSVKYGTPKCEFITQLLYVDDEKRCSSSSGVVEKNETLLKTDQSSMIVDHSVGSNTIIPPTITYKPVWIGAHPSLGERIAEVWLRNNLIKELSELSGPIIHVQNQIMNPCGSDNIRSDFCITHADGTKRIVEVKTVVDTDYSSYAIPQPKSNDDDNDDEDQKEQKKKKKKPTKAECIFTNDTIPYQRAAIFPWGTTNQKGPNGEAVVSTRAIHHVRELTRIASGELTDDNQTKYKATILFVIVRNDIEYFYPNDKACPSFCKYLKVAYDSGVDVIAKRVSWSNNNDNIDNKYPLGICFHDPQTIPIVWPTSIL